LFRIGIFSSYLFTECLTNFGICTLVFTFTAFMSQIFKLTEMIVNAGLGLREAMILVVLFVPSLLGFVIPISFLIGCLITLGRMSSDGEIIAAKASGMSLRRLFRPILLVSLIAYLITTLFTVYMVPRTSYALKRFLYNIARTKAEIGLKERIFNTNFSGLMIYVDEIPIHGQRLKGVLISDTRQTDSPATIVAQEGLLISEPDKLELTLHLENGSIHRLDRKGRTYQLIDFATYSLNLDLRQSLTKRRSSSKDEKEMLNSELLAQAAAQQHSPKKYPLLVNFHSRFAIPFACLVFGLVAVPLGVYSPRSGRSYGFVIGLIIVLIYYVLFSFGKNLGGTGVVDPLVAMWIPNGVFLLLAFYLFRKGQQESSIALIEHLSHGLKSVQNVFNMLLEGSARGDAEQVTVLQDLNNDGEQMLMLKLGISADIAAQITEYRKHQGEIKSFDELRKVPGIDDAVFRTIKEHALD
ncbi:MAG TPA: LPS export ABC transporter permease LptF, partial [Thermodesulfobacteriota bacterium]|nr:LPS export ABC transporter permease LptF [Thermodesulfobacteriota bacterium]